ncbi:MAG: hypothetical protein ABI210_01530 [Abditibacteriaceae bacterium]
MTSWSAPYTGGYERVLPAGETFRIINDPPEHATAVYADAENYKKLHKDFVPLSDRMSFIMYRGYYLCIQIKDIEEKCERLGDD